MVRTSYVCGALRPARLQDHEPTFDCSSPVTSSFPTQKKKFFFPDSHPKFGSEKNAMNGPKGLPAVRKPD